MLRQRTAGVTKTSNNQTNTVSLESHDTMLKTAVDSINHLGVKHASKDELDLAHVVSNPEDPRLLGVNAHVQYHALPTPTVDG